MENCEVCERPFNIWDDINKIADIKTRLNDIVQLTMFEQAAKEGLQSKVQADPEDTSAVDTSLLEDQYAKMQRQRSDSLADLNKTQVVVASKAVTLSYARSLAASLESRKKWLSGQAELVKMLREGCDPMLKQLSEAVEERRWRVACRHFSAMPIAEVDDGTTHSSNKVKLQEAGAGDKFKLTGLCTISGLPLLNSGDYSSLAAELVSSALARVCHLVDCLSTVLNVPVLHKIEPFTFVECTIAPQHARHRLYHLNPALDNGGAATGMNRRSPTVTVASPSVGCEGPSSNAPQLQADSSRGQFRHHRFGAQENRNLEFSSALVLLRHDVLYLCHSVGIDPKHLFPPEAILLNLLVLSDYCATKAKSSSTLGVPLYHRIAHDIEDGAFASNRTSTTTLESNLMYKYRRAVNVTKNADNTAGDFGMWMKPRRWMHAHRDSQASSYNVNSAKGEAVVGSSSSSKIGESVEVDSPGSDAADYFIDEDWDMIAVDQEES